MTQPHSNNLAMENQRYNPQLSRSPSTNGGYVANPVAQSPYQQRYQDDHLPTMHAQTSSMAPPHLHPGYYAIPGNYAEYNTLPSQGHQGYGRSSNFNEPPPVDFGSMPPNSSGTYTPDPSNPRFQSTNGLSPNWYADETRPSQATHRNQTLQRAQFSHSDRLSTRPGSVTQTAAESNLQRNQLDTIVRSRQSSLPRGPTVSSYVPAEHSQRICRAVLAAR